jgi:hypothetical protein
LVEEPEWVAGEGPGEQKPCLQLAQSWPGALHMGHTLSMGVRNGLIWASTPSCLHKLFTPRVGISLVSGPPPSPQHGGV